MDEPERPLHKRTKSALNLLRRTASRPQDDGNVSDTGSVGNGPPSSLPMPQSNAVPSRPYSPTHSHQSRQSTNMAGLTSSTSASSQARNEKPVPSLVSEKSLSIEQSVRKFRIFEALRNGDTASISKAIRENAEGVPRKSTSSAEGGGQTARLEDTTILHLAIQCAEEPVVEYVLGNGGDSIDVNARDKEGNTPLHIAATQGRGHIVRILLEQKDINDSIANYQGRLPLDLARTPDIFQQLQLSRSIFVDGKIREIQQIIAEGDYKLLGEVLEEPRVKTVLDINGGEFVSDIITMQSGGTLLHEAARKKNTKLIQVLLMHGADPFRRDRRGKLPQDVTKDEVTRAVLKKSPAAVAAQRGIQEKAVLGNATSQGAMTSAPGDALAGKESREMKGYLKKWTNYRKGYQLRWFVLEDGVLSYYKHQDDAGSACRGAINMRIAKLNMDPTEKQKFEIIGKSSVKYALKANHEIEAKRWFWALNNSIQWTKDQAKEEEKYKARSAEMLRQAKAEAGKGRDSSASELAVDSGPDTRRNSQQSNRLTPQQSGLSRIASRNVAFAGTSTGGSVMDDDEGGTYGSNEPSIVGDVSRTTGNVELNDDTPEEEDYGDDNSSHEAPASKDAFDITAQSAKMQLDMMTQVHSALQAEQQSNGSTPISNPNILQAVTTYDESIRSLRGLLGDLLRISRDRDSYWQHRLDREAEMRRMWEDSMAQVAREQEVLEARMGASEEKRKKTKRALREVIEGGSSGGITRETTSDVADDFESVPDAEGGRPMSRKSTAASLRRKSIMAEITNIPDSDTEDDEEFFDAVDAGEVHIAVLPMKSPIKSPVQEESKELVKGFDFELKSSFKGYEDGIRKRLKMDADDRPKISLWSILKSMIGKDMTKMTLPVSFNEPTSLLQRCAEDMEYTDLLDLAADRPDSAERMVYVAAFATSSYSSTIGRIAKPFNPLLGETYEFARPDKGFRFFIEQVSHHPPIGAAYSDSPRWTYWGMSHVKSKFYGKSFDINPLGTWFLKVRPSNGAKEELYTWKKVTTSVIGIITGSPTVDNYGLMEIKNWTTGEVCTLDFKPRGWTAGSAYQVNGRVNDAFGKPRFSIGGRWNNKLYARLTPGYEASIEEPRGGRAHHRNSISDPNQVFLVWDANHRPAGIPFNLTPFVVTLNDAPEKLIKYLPPTDTRLRPDQRAMEDGEYALAATEKNRVEEKQRAKRREREKTGEVFEPKWFVLAKHETTGEEYWKFNDKYWAEREKAPTGAAWEGVEDIFGQIGDDKPGAQS